MRLAETQVNKRIEFAVSLAQLIWLQPAIEIGFGFSIFRRANKRAAAAAVSAFNELQYSQYVIWIFI